jgi:hypothetical protein
MTLEDIKAKYGVEHKDAEQMTFAVPVSYEGMDVFTVRVNSPDQASKACEKLVEEKFRKAGLKVGKIRAGKGMRSGIMR